MNQEGPPLESGPEEEGHSRVRRQGSLQRPTILCAVLSFSHMYILTSKLNAGSGACMHFLGRKCIAFIRLPKGLCGPQKVRSHCYRCVHTQHYAREPTPDNSLKAPCLFLPSCLSRCLLFHFSAYLPTPGSLLCSLLPAEVSPLS